LRGEESEASRVEVFIEGTTLGVGDGDDNDNDLGESRTSNERTTNN
jgi:hypothetical protein